MFTKINATLAAVAIAGMLATPAPASAGPAKKAYAEHQARMEAAEAEATARRAELAAARDKANADREKREACSKAWTRHEKEVWKTISRDIDLFEIATDIDQVTEILASTWSSDYNALLRKVLATLERPASLEQMSAFVHFGYALKLTDSAPAVCVEVHNIKHSAKYTEKRGELKARFMEIATLADSVIAKKRAQDTASNAARDKAGRVLDKRARAKGYRVAWNTNGAYETGALMFGLCDSAYAARENGEPLSTIKGKVFQAGTDCIAQQVVSKSVVFYSMEEEPSARVKINPKGDVLEGNELSNVGDLWVVVGVVTFRNAGGSTSQALVAKRFPGVAP
jgi:hypothetical protein